MTIKPLMIQWNNATILKQKLIPTSSLCKFEVRPSINASCSCQIHFQLRIDDTNNVYRVPNEGETVDLEWRIDKHDASRIHKKSNPTNNMPDFHNNADQQLTLIYVYVQRVHVKQTNQDACLFLSTAGHPLLFIYDAKDDVKHTNEYCKKLGEIMCCPGKIDHWYRLLDEHDTTLTMFIHTYKS